MIPAVSRGVIGLTGGIATGKSTVAALLASRGAVIVDADRIAREVVEPGTEGLAAVVERFGPEVLRPDGTLDRERVGAIVFGDAAARADLEAILHPRIRLLMAERIGAGLASGAPLVVADIPLLYESGRAGDFPEVLLVYADEAAQLRRLMERDGLSEDAARQRLAAQLPIDGKRSRATWVIDNTGTRDETEAAVDRWWRDNVTA